MNTDICFCNRTMSTHFRVSSTSGKKTKTLETFDLHKIIKPKNRLRWEYLRSAVPESVLNATSVFVLKAAVDGTYNLTEGEKQELDKFADYVARLPEFKLIRLGNNNNFVNTVRLKRKQHREASFVVEGASDD